MVEESTARASTRSQESPGKGETGDPQPENASHYDEVHSAPEPVDGPPEDGGRRPDEEGEPKGSRGEVQRAGQVGEQNGEAAGPEAEETVSALLGLVSPLRPSVDTVLHVGDVRVAHLLE